MFGNWEFGGAEFGGLEGVSTSSVQCLNGAVILAGYMASELQLSDYLTGTILFCAGA